MLMLYPGMKLVSLMGEEVMKKERERQKPTAPSEPDYFGMLSQLVRGGNGDSGLKAESLGEGNRRP